MTKFEMKKNELIEKGEKDGYVLIGEIVEISKECKITESEALDFQRELSEHNIEILDKAPIKKKTEKVA